MSSNQYMSESCELSCDELNGKEGEQEAKESSNQFNYKESDAFKLISSMCVNEDGTAIKEVTTNMLKSLVKCIVVT